METPVQITLATNEQRDVVARLMQFYIYDFTELLAPKKVPHLNTTGSFDAYPGLDAYWSDPDHAAWVIYVGEQLAGFALLNKHSHVSRPVDFNMAEFFVARPFRRRGVARAAFHQLLRRHAGSWEVAIGAYNKPAQDFWPRAITAANVSELETLQGDGVAWTGTILRFRV
ncbi:MAG: GNAT family N-acetyltransferase [Alphaproteobacteria bacterium]|nr:GNAT family N-acetyltransferase [Alphaproteobacteria bacterium]